MIRDVTSAKKTSGIENKASDELTNDERSDYMDSFHASQKVGIRNLSQEGNILTGDTVIVPFPFYRNVNSPEDSLEAIELADQANTALILATADSKLIVQHRSAKNTLYREIPGASVAGQFDRPKGKPPVEPGTLPEITTDTIKLNAVDEMETEIGLKTEDVGDIRITGFAKDNVAVHHEFLLFAKSNLTSGEIEVKAEENAAKQNRGEYDFDERFFVINGDANSIRKLLTEVKCPIPSTHTAAFIAAWYSEMLETVSPAEAKLNLKLLEEDIKKNYQTIDLIVKAYDPDAKGFDPAKTPEEQGLPDIVSELQRTGLLEITETKEKLKSVPRAFLFDVDGPLSDPKLKRVAEPEIAQAVADRINMGEIVADNTGRSVEWLLDPQRHALDFVDLVEDKSKLADVILVGEKGATWATYENGEWITHVDDEIGTLPESLQTEVKDLIQNEFSDCMFFDETKLTMISTEMHDNFSIPEFTKRQQDLVERLNEILERPEYQNLGLRVDPTQIATDVQKPYVGKHFGARRIEKWLSEKGIKPEHFIAIGDSQSDTEMAEELQENFSTEFVFVGDPSKFDPSRLKCEVTVTNQRNAAGTLEFLNSLN